MEPTVKIFDSLGELSGFFVGQLAMRIREVPAGGSFSWMLSGGSTPGEILRHVGNNLRDAFDWRRVKIFWGDERCVGPEDGQSNYKMARENLLDLVPIPPSNIYRIHGESDPVTEAARYSEEWKQHAGHGDGIPEPDLLMLGLGEDGHTASIFPGNIHLFHTDKLFEPAEHPVTKQRRITATGRLINSSKTVILIATGNGKASITAQVLNRLDGWDRLPAALVRPENGQLLWLLDREAGIYINQKAHPGQ